MLELGLFTDVRCEVQTDSRSADIIAYTNECTDKGEAFDRGHFAFIDSPDYDKNLTHLRYSKPFSLNCGKKSSYKKTPC